MLQYKIVFADKYIQPNLYTNIVVAALNIKEYNWAKNFLESYKKHIEPMSRKNFYTFSLVKYYFAKNEYEKILGLLQTVEFDFLHYNLEAKKILLIIYYERADSAFYYFADAFKIYLSRAKMISAQLLNTYYNFLRFTRKAFHIRLSGNKKAKEKLIQQLEQTQNVTSLQWLRERVNEL